MASPNVLSRVAREGPHRRESEAGHLLQNQLMRGRSGSREARKVAAEGSGLGNDWELGGREMRW